MAYVNPLKRNLGGGHPAATPKGWTAQPTPYPGFTPFVAPTAPPPGTYDPGLDAQLAAAARGYGDLQQDYEIRKARAQDDFTLNSGILKRHLDEALANIGRNYTNLGNQQSGTITTAGEGSFQPGILQQALTKRMANQKLEEDPLNANYTDQIGRMTTALDRGYGLQGDETLGLARAGRENTQLGLDIGSQRWYQATQAGYDPPQKPKNEFGSGANVYRIIKTPRGKRRLTPTGHLLPIG